MNEYKLAWYQQIVRMPSERPMPERAKRTHGVISRGHSTVTKTVGRELAIPLARGAASRAAQTAMTGRIGTVVRFGGRVGVRIIPVVGYAMLAYDLYQFGKWAMED